MIPMKEPRIFLGEKNREGVNWERLERVRKRYEDAIEIDPERVKCIREILTDLPEGSAVDRLGVFIEVCETRELVPFDWFRRPDHVFATNQRLGSDWIGTELRDIEARATPDLAEAVSLALHQPRLEHIEALVLELRQQLKGFLPITLAPKICWFLLNRTRRSGEAQRDEEDALEPDELLLSVRPYGDVISYFANALSASAGRFAFSDGSGEEDGSFTKEVEAVATQIPFRLSDDDSLYLHLQYQGFIRFKACQNLGLAVGDLAWISKEGIPLEAGVLLRDLPNPFAVTLEALGQGAPLIAISAKEARIIVPSIRARKST